MYRRVFQHSFCLYLQIVLWVPIGIIDDNGVSSSQIDTQASGSRTQQEDESIGLGFREAVDGRLTQVACDATVDALVWIAGDESNINMVKQV